MKLVEIHARTSVCKKIIIQQYTLNHLPSKPNGHVVELHVEI
jgi:hypothetical protein